MKERFISTCTSLETRRRFRGYFDAIEPAERLLSKDVSAFDQRELRDVLSGFGGVRTGNYAAVMLLRNYVSWCLENKVDGTRVDIFDVQPSGVADMRLYMVSSPSHLNAVLSALLHSPEEKSTDDIIAAYVWLAFSGLPEIAAGSLTSDDVDMINLAIHYDSAEYPLYKEAEQVFLNCARAGALAVISSARTIYKPRADVPYLLRDTSGAPVVKKLRSVLTRKVSHAMADGLPAISYSRVWLSGVFYRLFEREKSGAAIDLLSDTPEEIARQISQSKAQMTTKYRNHCIRQYESDYLAWKQAFYPNTP